MFADALADDAGHAVAAHRDAIKGVRRLHGAPLVGDDDSNLQRLLDVFDELRESSQLIVVTHQRRTMEAADALYGVTMRGDGVSSVISQRVREREPA